MEQFSESGSQCCPNEEERSDDAAAASNFKSNRSRNYLDQKTVQRDLSNAPESVVDSWEAQGSIGWGVESNMVNKYFLKG